MITLIMIIMLGMMMIMTTLIEKKRLRGRVASTRRPEARVIKKAQRPGPPSRAAAKHNKHLN